MMKHSENCPIRNVLAVVTGKWQILILIELSKGKQRFGVLKRLIGNISQRVLTEKLRSLERDGYLTRSVDPGPPIAVTYELTNLGFSLIEHLVPMIQWASEHHGEIELNRQKYDG